MKLNREDLSRMIQVVTGHGFNRYHQKVAGLISDDKCRFCEGAPEESWHLINDCPYLSKVRHDFFKAGVLDFPVDLLKLPNFLIEVPIDSIFSPG